MTPENYIRNAIKANNLTLETIANAIEMNIKHLRKCLESNMRLDEYLTLCAYLNLDPRGYLKDPTMSDTL